MKKKLLLLMRVKVIFEIFLKFQKLTELDQKTRQKC